MRTAPLPTLFSREVKSIHCVGVAGMGVGPLAIYLAQLGFTVSGEDDAMIEAMRVHLERANVTLTVAGAVPEKCDLVVCSSAISPAHPASVAAASRTESSMERPISATASAWSLRSSHRPPTTM